MVTSVLHSRLYLFKSELGFVHLQIKTRKGAVKQIYMGGGDKTVKKINDLPEGHILKLF